MKLLENQPGVEINSFDYGIVETNKAKILVRQNIMHTFSKGKKRREVNFSLPLDETNKLNSNKKELYFMLLMLETASIGILSPLKS